MLHGRGDLLHEPGGDLHGLGCLLGALEPGLRYQHLGPRGDPGRGAVPGGGRGRGDVYGEADRNGDATAYGGNTGRVAGRAAGRDSGPGDGGLRRVQVRELPCLPSAPVREGADPLVEHGDERARLLPLGRGHLLLAVLLGWGLQRVDGLAGLLQCEEGGVAPESVSYDGAAGRQRKRVR